MVDTTESLPTNLQLKTSKSRLGSPRHSRRASGRPRIDAPGVAVLSKDRRDQVRRAQQKHRLKQKLAFEDAVSRLSEVEAQLERARGAFSNFYRLAYLLGLDVSHPSLHILIEELRTVLDTSESSQSAEKEGLKENTIPAAVMTSRDRDLCEVLAAPRHRALNQSSAVVLIENSKELYSARVHCSPSETASDPQSIAQETQDRALTVINELERPFSGIHHITYSFQEHTFVRKLHRYCLEYAFRLFIDPSASPSATYRVFRLVPCMRDKKKMYPYFHRLVTGGAQDALELPSLPFYCVGGAGTHYPRTDDSGRQIYPSNMRLPRRVLGTLPIITSVESDDPGEDARRLLKLFDLGGEYFDCNDIEGYLRARGVDLNQSCLFPPVSIPGNNDIPYQTYDIMQLRSGRNICPPPTHTLDVESFFTSMCQTISLSLFQFMLTNNAEVVNGVIILGRVPGFRRDDVERAFYSSLRRKATA
ncbi:hypothetical protein TSTA_040890 [Talaromyces stipitatus ATCC 10500]|uniref:BZIP domain-containing protein n=1 Tax=Talaromyces stipitatus (strain ATCC 10500 / CBS 375.48 / QM 6759 / NRRL 1006) TaxID=441959 RepID=B8MIC6_TALSN|nr:uncharacterized protein TSTA_040890 [Talaromyces stipitatus ATCC 10500]EED14610.1 hypothetical protein TSTA_040890 [Talaromyces stipitatus ATCC 10500]